jgi:hypothetical protein
MVHQVGDRLREQIHRFSGELCTGLGKVASRFVEEMIFGISASGSVVLTRIARSLEEAISLHDTHKRLSRNLGNRAIRAKISKKVLDEGAERVGEETLLIVDLSDLIKKYARRMEHLGKVRDGSENKIGNGYWLCEVVGAEVGRSEITPLAQRLWSQKADGFVSENDEILTVVREVLEATNKRGILVLDRGGDRGFFYQSWVSDRSIDFIIRQRGDRHVLYRGRARNTLELSRGCSTPYQTIVIREKDGKEKVYSIGFGFLPVRLVGHSDRPLWLVVVKGFGQEPMMLLTTRPMRRNRRVLWQIVEAYITRWRIEDTIRFIKNSYEFEDVRLLTYSRLQNMASLVLAAAYFTAVRLGTQAKLKILALHVLKAAKRVFGIPDFRYYALADGIQTILRRIGKGPVRRHDQTGRPPPQLILFET